MISYFFKFLTIFFAVSTLTACDDGTRDPEEHNEATEKATNPDKKLDTNTDPIPLKNASTRIQNLSYFLEGLKVHRYHDQNFKGQGTSIAILDNGFQGWKGAVENGSLPKNLTFVGNDPKNPGSTNHGTGMAQLIYGIAPQAKILLMHAQGLSNFEKRVEDAIEANVDIILYSQVWEYGGNFDGGGFINQIVNRAIDHGIIWINAAGNYALASYNGDIKTTTNSYIELPYSEEFLRFEVPDDATPIKITLSWNDFTEDRNYRTSKDLNFELYDQKGQKISESIWIQDGIDHSSENQTIYSSHAREWLRTTLNAGTYQIKVKNMSHNFDSKKDRFRLSIDGMGVQILDISTSEQDSIKIPAENPRVLTVGASDVIFSSFKLEKGTETISKPNIIAPSLLSYDNGAQYAGSSSAAAAAAGSILVYGSSFGFNEIKKVYFSQNNSSSNALLLPRELLNWQSKNQLLPGTHYRFFMPSIR